MGNKSKLIVLKANLWLFFVLKNQPENRTGFYGIEDIKKHGWLKNVPWQKICIKPIYFFTLYHLK